MNRARPVDLRKALEVANTYVKAGILFVCVPVMDKSDHSDLMHLARQRLGKLADETDEGTK